MPMLRNGSSLPVVSAKKIKNDFTPILLSSQPTGLRKMLIILYVNITDGTVHFF